MSSLWKDLLFLHGHLAHKDDLLWRDQAAPESHPKASAENASEKAGVVAKAGATSANDCVSHWPRLAAPH